MGSTPKFLGELQNVTVSMGREATFTCTVTRLGGHRVSKSAEIEVYSYQNEIRVLIISKLFISLRFFLGCVVKIGYKSHSSYP